MKPIEHAVPLVRAGLTLEADPSLPAEQIQRLVRQRVAKHVPVLRRQLWSLMVDGGLYLLNTTAPALHKQYPALRHWLASDLFRETVEEAVTIYIHVALYAVLDVDCFVDVEYVPLLALWIDRLHHSVFKKGSYFGAATVDDMCDHLSFAAGCTRREHQNWRGDLVTNANTALTILDAGIKQIKEDWQAFEATVDYMSTRAASRAVMGMAQFAEHKE